jgi:type I restriction enzyme M protein
MKNDNDNLNHKNGKSLESWIWDAACSIRGAKDAAKYKDYILPLIFVKRLCDVFDDEVNRIAKNIGNRSKAYALIEKDRKLVRYYLPLKPSNPETEDAWSVIRKLSSNIGEQLTNYLRDIARENPSLSGIIDRVDFNATTHGQRDIADDRLSNLIERISQKSLGLDDVEPDIIGRSYEYLIRKFAENSGKSAGEFYTPTEVGFVMAKIMNPEAGMEIYDPTCGSGGLLIKNQIVLDEKVKKDDKVAPLKLYGQEYIADTWAMAKMNMIVHDMEGDIEIGDTMKNPKFLDGGKLKQFDRVVANPMWNQSKDSLPYLSDNFYTDDHFERFPKNPGGNADWAWMQHILASMKDNGKAAIVLDTGATSRGSGNKNTNKEKDARQHFIDNDFIEGVIYLPENLFYNTTAPGIVIFLNKAKKHKDKVFMINASKEFAKGDPKNYITVEGIEKIAKTFIEFKEVEKFSKFISKDEIVANDYNISPSRYIHVSEDQEHRAIEDIVAELREVEKEAKQVDRDVWDILTKMGYE